MLAFTWRGCKKVLRKFSGTSPEQKVSSLPQLKKLGGVFVSSENQCREN